MDYVEAFWGPVLTMFGILLGVGSMAYGVYLMFQSGRNRPTSAEIVYFRPHWVWMLPFPVYELRVLDPDLQDPDDYFDSYPEDM